MSSGEARSGERRPAEGSGHAGPSAALLPDPVRIIGTGLIGGSLGLALSAAGVTVQVEDASPGIVALAEEMGVGTPADDLSPEPALVVIAAPPDVTAHLVDSALRRWPGAIVTDVASVKETVLEEVRRRAPADALTRYVGAHPMAGREVSGVIAARGDLFRGRPFVVVPHEQSAPTATSLLRTVATEIGSVPVVLEAADHDRAVAHVSHVPQLVSSVLATTLLQAKDGALALAGQGLRDTTRIADSDPHLWTEILSANAAAVGEVLDDAIARLTQVRTALDTLQNADRAGTRPGRLAIAEVLRDGNRGAARIPGKHGSGTDDFATVAVLVPDRPGELGRLFTTMGEIGINLEDLRLEHTLGRRVGIAYAAVMRAREDRLITELSRRGWTVTSA